MKDALEGLKRARPDTMRAYSMQHSLGEGSQGSHRDSILQPGGGRALSSSPMGRGRAEGGQQGEASSSSPLAGVSRSASSFLSHVALTGTAAGVWIQCENRQGSQQQSHLTGKGLVVDYSHLCTGGGKVHQRTQYCIHVNKVRELVEHFAGLMDRPYAQVWDGWVGQIPVSHSQSLQLSRQR